MESEDPENNEKLHLSFGSAGGSWWNENYLESLYEDLDIIEQEEPELARAFEKYPYCIVMIYGCAIHSTPPSWDDIGETYMDYTDIEVQPILA